MSFVKWSALGTLTTALSTELDALASNARAISGAIANATDKNRWAEFELNATFAVAPTAGGFCSLYAIPALDGTNYSDGDASIQPPETMLVGVFPVRAVTSAQRVHLRAIALPPTNFKLVLRNESGQAMTASGHTLKYRTYNEEVA